MFDWVILSFEISLSNLMYCGRQDLPSLVLSTVSHQCHLTYVQALAKPILKQLRGGGNTVPIGVHMRMGDSNIATTTAWSTHQNYPLGCEQATVHSRDGRHLVTYMLALLITLVEQVL